MAIGREVLPMQFMKHKEEEGIDKKSTTYMDRYKDEANGEDAVAARKSGALSLVNEYYDICTDFYEYGWGQSFHFAPRYVGETFYESLARHEYFLALHGGFKADMKLLDVGCGVGGPLRNMVRFTGCHVTGVNNNAYQIGRAQRHDARFGLSGKTAYEKCDFNTMPFADGNFDGAYAIEATCHAADKTRCFSEIFRTLKSGARFVGYEWVLTPKYDDSNPEHRRIRHGIEFGNALPTLETAEGVKAALVAAGFIVEDAFDVIERFENGSAKTLPWYEPFLASYTSFSGLKSTPVGRFVTATMVRTMEFLRLAPKGSHHAAHVLEEAAINLTASGKLQIFTPCYFFVARKP